jgi:hypothetical protein
MVDMGFGVIDVEGKSDAPAPHRCHDVSVLKLFSDAGRAWSGREDR